MNQFPPPPPALSIPLGPFRVFFRKFAEIYANECLTALSTIPEIEEKKIVFYCGLENSKRRHGKVFRKCFHLLASTGSLSCFCLSLGSRTPWGLFTRGSSYPGVFSSFIVLKHFNQMTRFPLFTDFFSNSDFSRILCIDF
jgi:hypothetical protein